MVQSRGKLGRVANGVRTKVSDVDQRGTERERERQNKADGMASPAWRLQALNSHGLMRLGKKRRDRERTRLDFLLVVSSDNDDPSFSRTHTHTRRSAPTPRPASAAVRANCTFVVDGLARSSNIACALSFRIRHRRAHIHVWICMCVWRGTLRTTVRTTDDGRLSMRSGTGERLKVQVQRTYVRERSGVSGIDRGREKGQSMPKPDKGLDDPTIRRSEG